MQAQRKYQDPVPATRVSWRAPDEDDAWSPLLSDSAARGTPSPTHLLWDELAARLQGPAPTPVGTDAAAMASAAAKWPMPLRLGVIATLSVAAWAAVYMAAIAII